MEQSKRKIPVTFYIRQETFLRLAEITRECLLHRVFDGRISVSRVGSELIEKYIDEFEKFVKNCAKEKMEK